MSQIFKPLAISPYLSSLVYGPKTILDFTYQSGLWIPIHNAGSGGSVSHDTNGSVILDMPGPNPGDSVNEQYLVGLKSRFRLFPDSAGKITYKIRIENLAFESFPVANGNAVALGVLNRQCEYSGAKTGGFGLGLVGRTDFSTSRLYGGHFYYTSYNGTLSMDGRYTGSYIETGGDYVDLKTTIEFSSTPGVEQVFPTESYVNFAGGGDNSISFGGLQFLTGLNTFDGIQPYLILAANCLHDISAYITQFTVLEGAIAWGI